jgi:preprotein translocase subunit SecE
VARKRASDRGQQRKSGKSQNSIVRYFQETREELQKVTWPSQDETLRLTGIVLATTVTFSAALGLLDFIFQRLASLLV